mgnify:FL=1
MAISLPTSTVPVLAETISIVDDVVSEEVTNDEINDDEITDEETTEEWAEDTSYNMMRSNNLNCGSMTIKKLSSTKIAINGITQCHRKCAKVYLYIYLERKVNGSYGTYKYWKFDASNVSNLTKEMTVIVPSGTYYRVRGYHAASNGGVKESTSTLTSGIKVS